MRLIPVFLFFTYIINFSCTPGTEAIEREAWVPVYNTNTAAVKQITVAGIRPTVNAGKIYTVGNLIYQVEQDSGIHVINYSNPSAPQKLGFIRSFLCKELSVKNGFIYTNNLADLVVIDASNISTVREVGRTPNVFPELALQYPPGNASSTSYFECADPAKGIVTGWVRKKSTNANCWRN